MKYLTLNLILFVILYNNSNSQDDSKWIYFSGYQDEHILNIKYRFYYDSETLEKAGDSCIVWVKQLNFIGDPSKGDEDFKVSKCYERLNRFVLYKSQKKYILTFYKEKNCSGKTESSDERESGFITPDDKSVISELFKALALM